MIRECVITPFNNGDILELVPDESEVSYNPLKVEIIMSDGKALVRGMFTAGIQKGVFEKTLKFKLTPQDGLLPQYLQIPIIALSSPTKSKSSSIVKK